MQSDFGAGVRKEVQNTLAATWAEFEPIALAGPMKTRGYRLFRWNPKPTLWFYLLLQIDRKFNKFWFEFAWSDIDEYPLEEWPPHPQQIADSLTQKRGRLRFHEAIGLGFKDKQWKVGSNPAWVPEVIVPAAVADLKVFFEPIIKKVIERHGRDSPPLEDTTV